MRIEVDTKHDSKEDIKKVIKMLAHLVEDSATFDAFSSSSEPTTQNASYNSFPGMGFMDSGSSTSSQSDTSSSSLSQSEAQKENKGDFDFTDLETF